MRVLTSVEVGSVSGAGSAPLLNFNFDFFFSFFSIFKKTTKTVNVTKPQIAEQVLEAE
jgi:hypothetical protein